MSLFKYHEDRLDRLDRIETERETIYIEAPQQECRVNGIPVSVTNGLYNFWAWVSPISPYTQYIRDKGGFYQKDRKK